MADLVVQISGNIQIGKNELVAYLRQNKVATAVRLGLPFDAILDPIDPRLRTLFHSDPKRYGLFFEESCLVQRASLRLEDIRDKFGVVVVERGMIEGYEIFAKSSRRKGFLTKEQLGQCRSNLETAIEACGKTQASKWCEGLIVYLESSFGALAVNHAKKGIKIQGIPTGYLAGLNAMYNEYTNKREEIYKGHNLPVPELLTIDASRDLTEKKYLEEASEQIVKAIQAKLKK